MTRTRRSIRVLILELPFAVRAIAIHPSLAGKPNVKLMNFAFVVDEAEVRSAFAAERLFPSLNVCARTRRAVDRYRTFNSFRH